MCYSGGLTPFSPRSRGLAVPATQLWPLEPNALVAEFLMFRWQTSCFCVFVWKWYSISSGIHTVPRPTAALWAEPSVGASPTHTRLPSAELTADLLWPDLRRWHVSERRSGLDAQQQGLLSRQPRYRMNESREQPDFRSSLYLLSIQHVAWPLTCACCSEPWDITRTVTLLWGHTEWGTGEPGSEPAWSLPALESHVTCTNLNFSILFYQ